MVIVFPLMFTALFYAFFGFVLGDTHWVEHVLLWPGINGIVWRSLYACTYIFGLLGSFVGGASVDV